MSFLESLTELVGPCALLCEPDDTEPYLTDWRRRYHGSALAVVRPTSVEQIAAVVRLCAKHGVAIVPQGGNTGLCGGATPGAGSSSIVLAMGRLNRLRELDIDNGTMTVDAGCTLAQIQAVADQAERLFPLSLGSEGSCQIGGNISTNAGGTAVLRYGNMRELVLGIEAVLPDGRIWNGLRGLRKDNTGYDLKQLFIGGEGTLGIVTGAVLKLFPKPRVTATAWVSMQHLADAITLLGLLREACGERITSFEVVSRTQLDMVFKHIPGTRDPLDGSYAWALLIELCDTMQTDLQSILETIVGEALDKGIGSDAVIAASQAQAEALWRIRHSVSEANMKEGVSVSHDISVPISRLAEFVAAAQAALGDLARDACVLNVGHVGDGNLHFIVLFAANVWASLDEPDALAEKITAIVQRTAVALGGSISAEHGIGVAHRDELRDVKSAVELDLMRAVKHALDPRNLMNPGKLL
jgi:FAD/FMN-containing dehydrogenase